MATPSRTSVAAYSEDGGVVSLRGAGSSSCQIYLHGATVTSWRDFQGHERLYLSRTAVLDGSAPIRGGIPVCWPQFGPGERWPKQHGFARRLPWALATAEMDPAVPRAVLRLVDTELTRGSTHFPHRFMLTLTAALGDAGDLSVSLSVRNTGEGGFSFTAALHSYFAVADVGKVRISGLKGLSYKDNAEGMADKVEEAEFIAFTEEVDRCYVGTQNEVSVARDGVRLRKRGLPELVVWNPFVEKTRALPDMPNNDWQKFVCVEPAVVHPAVKLGPGEIYEAALELSSPLRK